MAPVLDRPFSADYDEQTRTVRVSGTIDELAGPRFRDVLQKYSQDFAQSLVVDLSDVDFMPSLAVGVLATAHKNMRSAGAELDLLAEDGTVAQRVLHVCAMPYRTA